MVSPERAAPHLVAADQVEWMGRLDRERDNLRVAFHECLGVLDPRPGLRLAGALCAFWVARNAALEVSDALAGLLARPEAQEPTPERGWAAVTLVELLSLRGGQHAVGVWGEAAKAIGRAHGDIELEVTATRCLSVMHRRQGDLDQAEAFGREALALGPAGSVSAHLRAILLMNMANVLDERCLVDAAREHMEEARRIAVQSGDEATLAMILNNLGVELLVLGELGPARAALADSLAIALRIEDGTSIRCANVNLGFAEIIEGDRPGARRFAVEMLAGARRAGDRVMVATGLLLVALARGDDAVVAARLHGAVDQRMEESGETFEQLEATLRARDQERLRDELGVEGFAIAHRDGRSLSSEAALALSSPDAPA
jgi:tetratricopeptide (TPR) repeat protein